MSNPAMKESKEQIMTAFAKLLSEHKKGESRVATKEEEAEKAKNQELLEQAATYTVDNIVNSMASLQLDFGRTLNELSQKLDTESYKLDDLKRAIIVQKEQLDRVRKVRLVADAVHILKQEHQERLKLLENNTTKQQEAIEKEIAQTRKIWEKEQQEFEVKLAEEEEVTNKKREEEAADYKYQTERDRKVEIDEYEEAKRLQERELKETNKEKEKAWAEREKVLSDRETEFKANQKKMEGFEETIKQETNKARGEAIRDAERDAKVKADLFEKEWELTKQGYDLKIQSLEVTIQKQIEEITELTAQLQAVTTQSQNLAMKAFQGNGNSAN
jgi:DNA repair exonuclease SbcCD ATPase subunit